MHATSSAAAYLTDFADLAVLLPLSALIAVILLIAGWRRGALVWTAAVAGTLAVMFVLKLAFLTCSTDVFDVESPSGHTAAAGAVYGTVFGYAADRAFGRPLLTGGIIAVVVALFGASRVLIGAHTPAEACVGAGVGFAAACLAVRTAGPLPIHPARLGVAAVPVALLALWLHGMRLPAEARIHELAAALSPAACR